MRKIKRILLVLTVGILMAPQAVSAFVVGPRVAWDFNPDPEVVEVILVARKARVGFGTGNRTSVWTYNGRIPGPTLKANVGDTLVVHFLNRLPEETTVHWHGVEVPANMDGSNIAQKAVPPGGYFRYEFKLLRAATFWYHPHIRTNEQIEKGLYGALIVRDRQEDKNLGLPWRGHVLLLDDVLLDEDGQIADPFPTDPLENALTQVNGREGNILLVNGRKKRTAWIRRGVPHRLRLINVSNTRFMRVSIPGHTMWRIGGDGGLLESPIEIPPIEKVSDPEHPGMLISDPDPSKGILLTPGERADVVFTPRGYGSLKLEWHDIARGRHSAFYNEDGSIGLGHDHQDGKLPPRTLMKFKLYGRHGGGEYIPPSSLRDIKPIDTADAGMIMSMFGHTPPDANGDVIFFVQMKDGKPLPFPKVKPADAPAVKVGETRIWEVHNLTGGDHNFHLHGFTFQFIETQFIDMDTDENNYTVSAPFLEDKDTILLPRRTGAKGKSRTITRLAVKFDDSGREGQVAAAGKKADEENSGGWVFHCHILEHADRGMMSFLQVMPMPF